MKNLKNEEKINFSGSNYELVKKEKLPFKTKGNSEIVVFKEKNSKNYYVFEKSQIACSQTDFLAFCFGEVHPFFYKFKYGDNFYKDAKEFHEDLQLDRYINNSSFGTFSEDFKQYELLSNENFKGSLGDNNLYPAIIIKKNSPLWNAYIHFTSNKLPEREQSAILNELKSNNFAVFCLSNGKITPAKHYTNDLSYNIIRGKNQIGNLIEVSFGQITVLLECGKELTEDENNSQKLEEDVLCRSYDAAIISHYHLDHAAYVNRLKCPIYMGKDCLSVLNAQNRYNHQKLLKNINIFNKNEEFSIKKGNFELKIKPILVDHSAYDSYMFLITGGDKTLLYTGDFRANGRKSFANTLNALPNKVYYLICEATNMFSKKCNTSEQKLSNKAAKIMAKFDHVFVFQAGTNIDRLVSFYKASTKNNKAFLIDTYVAGITQNLPNIPNPKTFKNVYTFWDVPLKINPQNAKNYSQDFRLFRGKRALGSLDVANPKHAVYGDLSNFCMLVRPSMLDFLKRVDADKKSRFNMSIFNNSVLIYSLWNGYKQKEDVSIFLTQMESLGVKIIDLHTSGHADVQTIDRLVKKVNPSIIEYVHYKNDKNL